MTSEEASLTRRIQLKELEILKVFQDICRRHNLRYFAIGGTCLGAVRHKGFIPWDDDVDVAMPYEDFARFKAVAHTELPSYYAVREHNKERHATTDYYFKICDKRTTFISNLTLGKHPDQYIGVYVDVFPVHGLPSGSLKLKFACFMSQFYIRANHRRRTKFSEMWNTKSRLLWLILSPLKLFLPYDYFTRKHEAMAVKYPFGCSDEIIFPWRNDSASPEGWYKNVFPYECFKSTTELPFEDITIAVPYGYDEYLTLEFGDYMTLPPEEQRQASHSLGAVIDLDRPYTYYIEHPEALPR